MIKQRHTPASRVRRTMLLSLGSAAALGLAGCNTAPRAHSESTPAHAFWSGRMALQLQDASPVKNQEQSFSATFELQGTPDAGWLQLSTPLGSSVARITWEPGSARLEQSGAVRESPSLETLVQDTLGTSIPVRALFAWLQGRSDAVDGWTVDLSRQSEGRIAATRFSPTPQASLRLILDR